jgi:glycosyltransferase involved in cell wall biosynthesis
MGVDPAECTGGDRVAARRRWGIRDDEVVVAHLANKSAEKGTVDLLLAAEALWPGHPKVRLLLAGPEMPNFQRHWAARPPSGPVTRLGVLTDDEKRDFFAAADLFCLPSRSDSFGLVFLEAWANGLPCVAYRAGGVPGVIRNGVDGLLLPCGDVAALAQGLAAHADDPLLRRALGEAGRQRTTAEFAWEPRLRLVRDTYVELTDQGRRR